MHKKFEEIEHTADIALQVWGKNLDELFLNAAEGMYSFIFADLEFNGSEDWKFSASDQSAENLLVIFLTELNYYISIKRIIICMPIKIKINKNSGLYSISCHSKSQDFPRDIFDEFLEIKAVTYHNLNITKDGGLLTVKIVFDI